MLFLKIVCFNGAMFLAISCIGQNFRFAHISDTHIGSPSGLAEEDLQRTVADINSAKDSLSFAILTGDITELGTRSELLLAKQLLDKLVIPWYIIPGNHDAGWSESGGQDFITIFGYDKFAFTFQGILFFGNPSGPYVRMSDGHIPRDAVNWMDSLLQKTDQSQPIVFFNHYPIDTSLDNWYEATDRLRKYHTEYIACGHGHTNKAMNFEGIQGIMGRSNLRAKNTVGGYNWVSFSADSITYQERNPISKNLRRWVAIGRATPISSPTSLFRPDYNINKLYPNISPKWEYAAAANIIASPVHANKLVFIGNMAGTMVALSADNGKIQWQFQAKGGIFSTAAVSNGRLIFGCADGNIYCLRQKDGKLLWKFLTERAVLGTPLVSNDTIFIGGSDHHFRALHWKDGKVLWDFDGLNGPVVSKPVLADSLLIFGAWDRHLYALHRSTGKLVWKWNNGTSPVNYSPAACIPVVRDGIVYITAPDRFITAIDAFTGITLWRNNKATVRESIGIGMDGKWILGKTMYNEVVAFAPSRLPQQPAWRINAGFGYDHVPSMLVAMDSLVITGTRHGEVIAVSPNHQQLLWKHKIDNSMVNTVAVVGANQIVVATMDGHVVWLNCAYSKK